MKYQGLVGQGTKSSAAALATRKATRVTWLQNVDFGGAVPSAFGLKIASAMMAIPIYKIREADVFNGTTKTTAGADAGEQAGAARAKEVRATSSKVDGEERDPFIAKIPTDISIDDCIVNKNKYLTIDEQRTSFYEHMRATARSDNKSGGWVFLSLTQMVGIDPALQLKVFQRTVEWSKVPQLRSVEETEFSCDEVFDFLLGREF